VADRIPDPAEAKRYLARKAVVETENWDDLKWGEHAHAFTAAHSRNAAVLDDIFGLLNNAMEAGESFGEFQKKLRGLMEEKGWYGRADKGPDDKDYIGWRTRLIYHVNMRTAYEAGRYRQQVRGAELRPVWEYISKLAGDNRRQEHIALHGKAFRYDDPFWDQNRPPNGWGCECSVVSLSEAGAERDGVEILASDDGGNPPPLAGLDGKAVDWSNFTPEAWRYNPGKEALAPDFSQYRNLPAAVIEKAREQYRADMDETKLTSGELKIIKNEMMRQSPPRESEYRENNPILYLVGNLDAERQAAMQINDPKIMVNGYRLYHGFGEKNIDQKVPDELFGDLYEAIQSPEEIYENTAPNQPQWGREFHFVKKLSGKKILNIVVRKLNGFAPQVITFGRIGDSHGLSRYKKLW
jgi:SPP1 gp7 family putative phage head morphogenesis protein